MKILTIHGSMDGTKNYKKVGIYDGVSYKSNKYTLNDLYNYNYIRTARDGVSTSHIPKRFFGDLEKTLRREYIRIFGESQQLTIL